MREHDGANVPVLKMTVPRQEKAGVFNVWAGFLLQSHMSHHRAARKQCTMVIASVVFRLLLAFSLLSQNIIPCTKGKSRKTKTETTCSTPQGPRDDFSKYFDLRERAI